MHKPLSLLFLFLLLSFSSAKQTKQGQNIVNACTSALMQTVPPVWCWIKGGDFGKVPSSCPSNYHRYGINCYQNCSPGYFAHKSHCIQSCKSGYTFNSIFLSCTGPSPYFPKRYSPTHFSNCDARVPCPTNMYKSGCLCYKDCSALGLMNCALGSCAIDSATCASTIINMIIEVAQGIGDFVLFCVSLGSSSGVVALKNSVRNGLQKAGTKGVEVYAKSIVHIFKSKFKKTITSNAKKAAKKLFKSFADGSIAKENPDVVCGPVYEYIEKTVKNKQASTVINNIVNTVDVFDVRGIVDNCSSGRTVECVQSCLDTAKNFDPTGLLTIARAFVQPVCEIPYTTSMSTLHKENDVQRGCIHLYSEVDYEGEKTVLCDTVEEISDNVKSLKVNAMSAFLLFKDETLSGDHILLDAATVISDVDAVHIRDLMKYAVKVNDDCVNVFITDNSGNDFRYEICEDVQIDIDFNDVVKFSIETYRNGVAYQLFENPDFSGKSVYLTEGVNGLKFADMSRIGAIKLNVQYDDYGFLCERQAGTKEIIRKGEYDVECFSFDGINCVDKEMTTKECLKFVNENIYELKPVTCGNAYRSRYDISGYDMEGHWCQKGMKYYQEY